VAQPKRRLRWLSRASWTNDREQRVVVPASPLSMLLFGINNWMFTWLRPDGELSYETMASIVTDLFFGGIPAVRIPRPDAQNRSESGSNQGLLDQDQIQAVRLCIEPHMMWLTRA
jgi:hypothetical protein